MPMRSVGRLVMKAWMTGLMAWSRLMRSLPRS